MKKLVLLLSLAVCVISLGCACPFSSKCPFAKNKASITEACAGCGEIKGSAKCCKPDAAKCGKCGLNKGSPGCCKIK